MTIPTCPCGKLINEGDVTCKSCAPAYRAGMMRIDGLIREEARNVVLDKVTVFHILDAIRKEIGHG